MWSAIALAFGLAMDATAVSAARALGGARRELVILPLLFGGFQAGMSALGWIAGSTIGPYIDAWDHWVAFALLVAIGGKMVRDAWRGDADGEDNAAATEDAERAAAVAPAAAPLGLYLGLAIATSIDAAAAGLTLPLVPVAPAISLALIGIVTAVCSAAGYLLGRVVGARFGAKLALVGGLVLIGIGVQILVRALQARP
jgi:putative Mn2+ efflux pump MntP